MLAELRGWHVGTIGGLLPVLHRHYEEHLSPGEPAPANACRLVYCESARFDL